MLRSLWTGASGMIAQQENVDTIANNLANVNTTGYKKEKTEFKSLLYQPARPLALIFHCCPWNVSEQIGITKT